MNEVVHSYIDETVVDEVAHGKAGEATLGEAAYDNVGETALGEVACGMAASLKMHAKMGMQLRKVEMASGGDVIRSGGRFKNCRDDSNS